MIDKQFVINNISNIEKLPNITILKMLQQFKEQLETSGAYHSITIGEVKTLEWEETAYVENVGTTTDLILNFGLPSGVGFNYVGSWASGNNEYHPYDVVLLNGSLYICTKTILDSVINPSEDSEHWTLFLQGVDLRYYYTISEIDARLENKVDKISSQKIVSRGSTGNTTSPTFNLSDVLGTWKRFSAYIKICANGGGTIEAIYNANSINASQYFSEVTTNLGSKNITCSFDINTKILTLGQVAAYSVVIIELIGTA